MSKTSPAQAARRSFLPSPFLFAAMIGLVFLSMFWDIDELAGQVSLFGFHWRLVEWHFLGRDWNVVDLGLIFGVALLVRWLFELRAADLSGRGPRPSRWRLLRCSAEVVARDPEIAVFGLTAAAVLVAVLGSGIWWILRSPHAHGDWGAAGTVLFSLLIAASAYFGGSILTLAVCACAIERLQGGKGSFRKGLAAMRAHAGDCVDWVFYTVPRNTLHPPSFHGVPGIPELLVIPVLLIERKTIPDAVGRAQALAEKHLGPGSAAWEVEDAAALTAMSSVLFVFLAVLGSFMLDAWLDGALYPSGMTVTAALARWAVPLALAALGTAFFAVLCGIIFICAAYLQATGSAQTKAAVCRHFPPGTFPAASER